MPAWAAASPQPGSTPWRPRQDGPKCHPLSRFAWGFDGFYTDLCIYIYGYTHNNNDIIYQYDITIISASWSFPVKTKQCFFLESKIWTRNTPVWFDTAGVHLWIWLWWSLASFEMVAAKDPTRQLHALVMVCHPLHPQGSRAQPRSVSRTCPYLKPVATVGTPIFGTA